MAVYKRDIVDINLETGNIHRTFLNHSIGMKDQKADHFGVRVFRDGEPVNLTGVSVQGVFMPPQGSPIAITSGNIVSENVAEVVLPQACYNYDGQFTLAIKLVDSTNSVTGTVRIIDGMVDNTHASGTVAPTSAVPTYQEVLSAYEQAIAVIGNSVRFDQSQSLTDAQKGTARTNIAAASESELSDVKSAFTSDSNIEIIDFENGKYIPNNGSTVDITDKRDNAGFQCAVVPCSEGDAFTITGLGGSTTLLYAFVKANGDSIEKSVTNANLTNFVLYAPADSAYLVINDASFSMSYKGIYVDARLHNTESLIMSKASMLPGSKTTSSNTYITDATADKFRCFDIYVDPTTETNAFLYFNNGTANTPFGIIFARNDKGVSLGNSGWFKLESGIDLFDKVSAYIQSASILSFTIAFSTTSAISGVTTGIAQMKYDIAVTKFKILTPQDVVLSDAECIEPESSTTATAPATGTWFTYRYFTLQAGTAYKIRANTRNTGTTASFALMDVLTNAATILSTDGNNFTVTPTNDSLLLFKNVKYGTHSDSRVLSATTQTLSNGTVVAFTTESLTTVTFDIYIDAVLDPSSIYQKMYSGIHMGVVTVSKDGNGNYYSINDAINNTQDGDTILIMPGIYTEKIKMWGKNRRLVGLSRESVLIVSTDRYYNNEPIQANIGSIENLTLIAGYGLTPVEGETQAGNYALHIEYANSSAFELIVRNCNIISNVCFAIGAGVRYNQTVKIVNCYLETKQRQVYSAVYQDFYNCGGIFFHNDASGSNLGTDGRIELTNCEMKGVTSALAIQSQNNGNTLTARFVDCLGWSTENGKTNAITIRTTPTEGHIAGSDVVLDSMSFGNNLAGLNP